MRIALAAAMAALPAAGVAPAGRHEPAEPPVFLHIPTGQPLDLAPRPGERLGAAVLAFHQTGVKPYRDDAAAIAEGRLLYRRHCAFCHRYDGSGGNAPPIDGSGWTYLTSAEDAGMFAIVLGGGLGAMRSWARQGLAQDEVLRIIAYVRRLAVPGPEQAEARRAATMALGGEGVQ